MDNLGDINPKIRLRNPNDINIVHPVIRMMITGWNFCLTEIYVASMANTGFMPVGKRDRKISARTVTVHN